MSELLQELSHTSTQLCKISKELGAVRNALAALRTREEDRTSGASPAAAADSLCRIADRLRDTAEKYRPYEQRLLQLALGEVHPRVHDKTAQHFGTCKDGLSPVTPSRVEAPSKRRRVISADEEAAEADEAKEALRVKTRGTAEPASTVLFSSSSYLRRCMQYDMVQYLLRTNRRPAAIAVARYYQLPMHYFDTVLASEMRDIGYSAQASPSFVGTVYPPLPEITSSAAKAPAGGNPKARSVKEEPTPAHLVLRTLAEAKSAGQELLRAVAAAANSVTNEKRSSSPGAHAITADLEATSRAASLLGAAVDLVSGFLAQVCEEDGHHSPCHSLARLPQSSSCWSASLAANLEKAREVLLALRCTELLLLHRAREEARNENEEMNVAAVGASSPGRSHEEVIFKANEKLQFVANHLLPLSQYDKSATIHAVAAFVSNSIELSPARSASTASALEAAEGVTEAARAVSEGRNRTIAETCDRLMSFLQRTLLAERHVEIVAMLQQSMEAYEQLQLALHAALQPVPNLVARLVMAAILDADAHIDEIVLKALKSGNAKETDSDERLDNGPADAPIKVASFAELKCHALRDILQVIERAELPAAAAATQDEERLTRQRSSAYRILEAYDRLHSQHFAVKRPSRLVCSSDEFRRRKTSDDEGRGEAAGAASSLHRPALIGVGGAITGENHFFATPGGRVLSSSEIRRLVESAESGAEPSAAERDLSGTDPPPPPSPPSLQTLRLVSPVDGEGFFFHQLRRLYVM